MADGDALHSTRTKAFLQSGIQKTLEKRLLILFPVFFSSSVKDTYFLGESRKAEVSARG